MSYKNSKKQLCLYLSLRYFRQQLSIRKGHDSSIVFNPRKEIIHKAMKGSRCIFKKNKA